MGKILMEISTQGGSGRGAFGGGLLSPPAPASTPPSPSPSPPPAPPSSPPTPPPPPSLSPSLRMFYDTVDAELTKKGIKIHEATAADMDGLFQ